MLILLFDHFVLTGDMFSLEKNILEILSQLSACKHTLITSSYQYTGKNTKTVIFYSNEFLRPLIQLLKVTTTIVNNLLQVNIKYNP